MTRSFRLTMLGFGVVAGIVLLVELVAPILAISSDSLENSRARSERVTQKKADTMVAEILKRPLFTAGRQPPQIRVVRAEPPKLLSRLAGTMMQADLHEALFSRPGARSVSVTEGEVVDGWTVKDIEPDHVLLTSAFGEQIVRPTNGLAEEIAAQAPRPVGKKTASTRPPNPGQSQKAPPMPGLPLFAGDLAQGRSARR